MLRRLVASPAVLTFTAGLVAAAAVAIYEIRPFHTGAVDFDSAASVLYFQRLMGGHRLEALVGATPKPLLTLLFGGLYSVVPDWRPIIWATIGAYATTVGLAAVLARRLAGLGAAAFTIVALIGSTQWLLDVARGYSIAWATLGWVIAALAVSAQRPRYGLAALALFLATLARVETFVLIGAAIAGLAIWAVLARSGRGLPPPRRAWLLVAAVFALPIMLLHDQLLTADPIYWLHVSERFSKGASAAIAEQGTVTIARWVVGRFIAMGGFAILSAVGIALLLSKRRWAIALGVLAATMGLAGFLVLLAARGTWVPVRYAIPMDLAVLFAAGLGFGALRAPAIPWPWTAGPRVAVTPGTRSRSRAVAVVLIAVVSASVLWAPAAFASHGDLARIRHEVRAAARADSVVSAIRRAIANVPNGTGTTTASGPTEVTDLAGIMLVVPPLLRPRFAVDTGIALTRIAGLGGPHFGTPESLVGVSGRIVVHDPVAEGAGPPAFAALERPDPVIAGVRLVPLFVDPAQRIWVYQVPMGATTDRTRV